MRSSNSSILLATAVFLAAITIVSSFAHTVNTVNTTKVSSIRSLRSDSAVVDNTRADSGERVGFAGVSLTMENLIKLLKNTSLAQKPASKAWLKSNVRPAEVFKTLRLNAGAAKLDDNPELVQWFRFAVAYRKVHGDQALPDLEIYFILLRQYEAKDVTSLIQSLKKTSGMKKLATSMENSLSGSWINENLGLGTDPAKLFNTLRLKEAGAKLDEVPVFHQWLEYVSKYRRMAGFGHLDMINLFRKTMPEENVVTLIHSLRQTPSMKEHANTMQKLLVLESKSNYRLLDVWLKAQESPETVYNILGLSTRIMDGYHDNVMVIQWLRYVQLLRGKSAHMYHAFSSTRMVRFLRRNRPSDSSLDFATLFQVLKGTPGLKTQVKEMQTYLFRLWLRYDIDPTIAAKTMASPHSMNSLLKKNDPHYLTWKAFTLFFAKSKGGNEMLKKVEEAFASGDPRAALKATVTSA